MERPPLRVSATVLDAPDAQALGAFYQRLLGWEVVWSEPGWMKIAHPLGELVAPGLSFQTSEGYVPPAWPNAAGHQQMQAARRHRGRRPRSRRRVGGRVRRDRGGAPAAGRRTGHA